MRKGALIVVGAVSIVAGIVELGLLLPARWGVRRSIVIDAPPTAIYPWVASFKNGWPQWSAFDFEDPDIRYTFSGPDLGAGAARSWVSEKMGDGLQKIVRADPYSGVDFDLVMKSNGFRIAGSIAFEAEGNSTRVTWTDSGDAGLNPAYRVMGLYLDRMMGPTFERSLAALKRRAEARI